MQASVLPGNLTSHDLLKSFALLTMVVDHVGFYLFPDQIEWRIVGRMSLPVWLFLVGYARTREISAAIVYSAIFLLATNLVLGEYLLPLNILVTILLARWLIDSIMQRALHSTQSMVVELGVLAVVGVPTLYVFDYGTHAFMFAMLGYLVRHRERLAYSNMQLLSFAAIVGVIHAATQAYLYRTDGMQTVFVFLGVIAVAYMLHRFRSTEYAVLTDRLPSVIVVALQFMGRHSLFLYVAHLLVLKLLAIYLVWGGVDWFGWRWFLAG